MKLVIDIDDTLADDLREQIDRIPSLRDSDLPADRLVALAVDALATPVWVGQAVYWHGAEATVVDVGGGSAVIRFGDAGLWRTVRVAELTCVDGDA